MTENAELLRHFEELKNRAIDAHVNYQSGETVYNRSQATSWIIEAEAMLREAIPFGYNQAFREWSELRGQPFNSGNFEQLRGIFAGVANMIAKGTLRIPSRPVPPQGSPIPAVIRHTIQVPEQAYLIGPEKPIEPSTIEQVSPARPAPARDPRRVFVVHGRNHKAKAAVEELCRALDLKPYEFAEVRAATKKPSPSTFEIVAKAFEIAQAIIVLLTDDETAQLRPVFVHDEEDGKPRRQPRPNVLFEAGMAFANPDHAFIVEFGDLMRASDLEGVHAVRIYRGSSPEFRQDIAQRLEDAGCKVDRTAGRWMTAGDFDAAFIADIPPTNPGEALSAKPATPSAELPPPHPRPAKGSHEWRMIQRVLGIIGAADDYGHWSEVSADLDLNPEWLEAAERAGFLRRSRRNPAIRVATEKAAIAYDLNEWWAWAAVRYPKGFRVEEVPLMPVDPSVSVEAFLEAQSDAATESVKKKKKST